MSLFAADASVVQYADDTQAIVSGKKNELQSLILKMETSLASLDVWFRANSLTVNTNKTQLMALGTRQNLRNIPNFEVTLRDTSLVPGGSQRMSRFHLLID